MNNKYCSEKFRSSCASNVQHFKINYKTKPAVNSKRTKPIASVSIRIPSAAIRSTGGPQHHSLCHPEEKDTSSVDKTLQVIVGGIVGMVMHRTISDLAACTTRFHAFGRLLAPSSPLLSCQWRQDLKQDQKQVHNQFIYL